MIENELSIRWWSIVIPVHGSDIANRLCVSSTTKRKKKENERSVLNFRVSASIDIFRFSRFSGFHLPTRERKREREGGRGRERERPGDSCVFVKISGAFPSIFVGTPELPGRGGNWRAASDELKRRSNEPNEPERPIRATRNRETTRTLTPLFSTRQNKRTLQGRLSCYAVRLTKRVNSRWSVYR